MLKLLITLMHIFFALIIIAQENVQEYHYHLPQSSTLNLGVGVPSTTQVVAEFVSLVDQDVKASPQFTLRYEYALNKNVGIGAYGGFFTGETESISLPSIQLDSILNNPSSVIDNLFGGGNGTTSIYKVNVITVGAQLSYHIYKFKNLDTYTLIRGGYNIVSVKEDGAKNKNFIGAQVPQFEYFAGGGLRYYFSEHIAVYGEIGNSILSPLHINLGGTIRF